MFFFGIGDAWIQKIYDGKCGDGTDVMMSARHSIATSRFSFSPKNIEQAKNLRIVVESKNR